MLDKVDVDPTIISNNIPGMKKSVNGVPESKLVDKLESKPAIIRIAPKIEVSITKIDSIVMRDSRTLFFKSGSCEIVLIVNSPIFEKNEFLKYILVSTTLLKEFCLY